MFCHLWWFPPLPGLLSLRPCRSTFWFPHLFPHPPHSCNQKEGGLLIKAEPRCEQRIGLFPALGKQRASNRDKSKLLQQYGNERNILLNLTDWFTWQHEITKTFEFWSHELRFFLYFSTTLYLQDLWRGDCEGGSLVLGALSPTCDALPEIQVQHDLSSVLLCVRLHAYHLHSLQTQEPGSHQPLCHHRLPPPTQRAWPAWMGSAAGCLPCLLCRLWWSWGSAGECWRPWWQEQWTPLAASPDTGRWTARLAGWSAGKNNIYALQKSVWAYLNWQWWQSQHWLTGAVNM